MKKNVIRMLAVAGILFALFTVTAFAVPFAGTGVFWLSYLFAAVAFGVAGWSAYTGLLKGEDTRSRFYGFPIARVGVVYLIAQIVVSLVFMALAAVAPVWPVLLAGALLLGAAGVGLISADAVREEVQRQDAVLKKDTAAMRALASTVRGLVPLCAGTGAEKAVEAFAEALRYSDPVSSEALTDIEAQLAARVDALQAAVAAGDHAAAERCCKQAALTLNERNRLCKLGK